MFLVLCDVLGNLEQLGEDRLLDLLTRLEEGSDHLVKDLLLSKLVHVHDSQGTESEGPDLREILEVALAIHTGRLYDVNEILDQLNSGT